MNPDIICNRSVRINPLTPNIPDKVLSGKSNPHPVIIIKGRQRWIDAGKPEDFITHFGRRYCPPDAHHLNKNWVTNVNYWKDKLEREAK